MPSPYLRPLSNDAHDAQPIHQHGLAYSGLRPPPASQLCQTLVPRMVHLEILPPVKTGTWKYADSVSCRVQIVRHDTYYGSGDSEDPPEISNDRDVECYYLLLGTPVGEPRWVGGGVAFSLADAISLAQAKVGHSLVWDDKFG